MRNRHAYWFKSMYPNPCAHDMKNIYWLGIAFLWMLPLNVLLLTAGKLMSGDALGEE